MLRLSKALPRAPLTRAIHSSTPKTNPSPLLSSTPSQYSSMKVASLKDECRRRGLRLGGKKADLIERLASHDFSTISKRPVASPSPKKVSSPNPTPSPVAAPTLKANPSPVASPTLIRLISSTAPTQAQGDTSTIDFCKLPHTGLPADAPRIKIPTSPDAYGEVSRYGTHAITNDRKVAESVAEDELHSKQPQEIHYASGHVVRSFTGDHSSEHADHEFTSNDKLVLGGIVGAVGFWWFLGLEGKVE
ncbi:Altered inheritance of mitochondria protein 34 [Yarrowia sp. B02]|nr:Altered inheritance of mitochondria protein 34 [Yarrowia sp. B02]